MKHGRSLHASVILEWVPVKQKERLLVIGAQRVYVSLFSIRIATAVLQKISNQVVRLTSHVHGVLNYLTTEDA